jgi:hypothetical protein
MRALVTEVVGGNDGVAHLLVESNERVAEGGVTSVADVERFVGVGLRISEERQGDEQATSGNQGHLREERE